MFDNSSGPKFTKIIIKKPKTFLRQPLRCLARVSREILHEIYHSLQKYFTEYKSKPCLTRLADNIRQNRIKNNNFYQNALCLTQATCNFLSKTYHLLKMHQLLSSHWQNVVKHNTCRPCPKSKCCKLRQHLLFTTPRATSALLTSWPSGQGEL